MYNISQYRCLMKVESGTHDRGDIPMIHDPRRDSRDIIQCFVPGYLLRSKLYASGLCMSEKSLESSRS